MGPIRVLLAPYLPYIVGGLVLAIGLAGWWAYDTVYDRGYEKAMREATEAAALASAAYQQQVDDAEARDTKSRAITNDKFKPLKERASNAPVDPNCPDPGTRQLWDEAVKAANDSAPARKG